MENKLAILRSPFKKITKIVLEDGTEIVGTFVVVYSGQYINGMGMPIEIVIPTKDYKNILLDED